jgi:tetratricopeptide (TPR) repeat protein
MGYKILPPEGTVNEMAYFFMQSKMPDRAYSLFAINIQNYPQSFNTYDSMGDYYSSQKDNAKAIEFYNKALKLNDNPETRKKRDELVAKK